MHLPRHTGGHPRHSDDRDRAREGDHPTCFSPCRSDSVKISTPVAVTPTECSNCADSERSRVTAVQPSERIFTCGLPGLIIGSVVKKMPGLSWTPSPGRPVWVVFGPAWDKRPRPWPQKTRAPPHAFGPPEN